MPTISHGSSVQTYPNLIESAELLSVSLNEPMLKNVAVSDAELVGDGKEGALVSSTVEKLRYIMLNTGTKLFDTAEDFNRFAPLLKLIVLQIRRVDVTYQLTEYLITNCQRFLDSSVQGRAGMFYTFREMLNAFSPKTYSTLFGIGALEDSYLDLLFTDLFVEILPEEFVLIMLDAFFLEGVKILFRYGLAIIKGYKAQIKAGEYTTAGNFWLSVKADATAYSQKASGKPVMLFKTLNMAERLPPADPFVIFSKAKNPEFLSTSMVRTYPFDEDRSMLSKLIRPMSVSSSKIGSLRRDSIVTSSAGASAGASGRNTTGASAGASTPHGEDLSQWSVGPSGSPGPAVGPSSPQPLGAGAGAGMRSTSTSSSGAFSSSAHTPSRSNSSNINTNSSRQDTQNHGGSPRRPSVTAHIAASSSTPISPTPPSALLSQRRGSATAAASSRSGRNSLLVPEPSSSSSSSSSAGAVGAVGGSTVFTGMQATAEDVQTAQALAKVSRLLNENKALRLVQHLPDSCLVQGYKMTFSTHLQGYSLSTLYSRCEGQSPCLVLAQLAAPYEHIVVGAFVAVPVSPPSKETRGDQYTAVFNLAEEGVPGEEGQESEKCVGFYPWIGLNNREKLGEDPNVSEMQFVVARIGYLCFGASEQSGSTALRFDEDLRILYTGSSDTFGNPPLLPQKCLSDTNACQIKEVEVLCGHSSMNSALGNTSSSKKGDY